MEIAKDFREFFALLNKHNVKYVVVGGYAYAIHARPRFTQDLDIFVETSPVNAERILTVLQEFGFGELDISKEDLLHPEMVIQIGYPPLRIDLLTSISGVSFSEAWEGRITVSYGGEQAFFIGKQELMRNKAAIGRTRDLDDLKELSGSEGEGKAGD